MTNMLTAIRTIWVAAAYDYGPRLYFEVLARAGGGGGGGGGRGGGSSGGGGGGGAGGGGYRRRPFGADGGMPWWLLAAMIALFGGLGFLVIFLFIRSRKKKKAADAASAGDVSKYAKKRPPTSEELASDLSKLREHDAGFDEGRFVAWAKETFLKVQQSWTELKAEDARPLMGDACFDDHQTRINEFIAKHEKNVLENLEITDASIMGVVVSKDRDEVTVRIAAQCADYSINTDTGDVVTGNKFVGKFAEDWQFERVRPDILASGGKAPGGGLDANWRLTRIDEVMG